MITRREFLKTAGLGITGLSPTMKALASRNQTSGFFGVHSFIENNPSAVFIMHTNVDLKTNSEAKKLAGLDFGRSVFVPKEESEGGIPLTHKVALKPNLTCRQSSNDKYTVEGTMGIVTDAYLVEGMIESMKELGIAGNQFYIREVNCPEDFDDSGYWEMAERTGADIRDMSPEVGVISENDLQWVDVPDGVYFRKIPYLWPINAPDTWLLNIAKLKAHGMGITLCSKNLQGTIAHYYQAHCGGWNLNMDSAHSNPDSRIEITENHLRHVEDGIPRWDRPGGGISMERWASRCLDNNSVIHPGLHIIDGVYSRDGDFVKGPGPDGLANDFMTNMIIFGKNHVYVDIIGHWIAGHEPGNFGLFHMAIERGMASVLNPMNIPVYEWKPDGSATLTPLTDFERTPLLTYYLQRDYDDQSESYWHMVDEPYDYMSVDEPYREVKPGAFVLHQNRPNPFNPFTSIKYYIPRSGYAQLEIYNASGQLVDLIVDGYRSAGTHMAVFNTHNHSSGVYFYRFRYRGFSETKKMVLLK